MWEPIIDTEGNQKVVAYPQWKLVGEPVATQRYGLGSTVGMVSQHALTVLGENFVTSLHTVQQSACPINPPDSRSNFQCVEVKGHKQIVAKPRGPVSNDCTRFMDCFGLSVNSKEVNANRGPSSGHANLRYIANTIQALGLTKMLQ